LLFCQLAAFFFVKVCLAQIFVSRNVNVVMVLTPVFDDSETFRSWRCWFCVVEKQVVEILAKKHIQKLLPKLSYYFCIRFIENKKVFLTLTQLWRLVRFLQSKTSRNSTENFIKSKIVCKGRPIFLLDKIVDVPCSSCVLPCTSHLWSLHEQSHKHESDDATCV